MVASYQPNDCGWSYQNLPVQHTINGGCNHHFFRLRVCFATGSFRYASWSHQFSHRGVDWCGKCKGGKEIFSFRCSSKDVFFGKIYVFFFKCLYMVIYIIDIYLVLLAICIMIRCIISYWSHIVSCLKKTEVSKFLTHCFVPKRNQFFSCQPIGFVGVALASRTLMRIKWKHTSKHITKHVAWNMLTFNPTGL